MANAGAAGEQAKQEQAYLATLSALDAGEALVVNTQVTLTTSGSSSTSAASHKTGATATADLTAYNNWVKDFSAAAADGGDLTVTVAGAGDLDDLPATTLTFHMSGSRRITVTAACNDTGLYANKLQRVYNATSAPGVAEGETVYTWS